MALDLLAAVDRPGGEHVVDQHDDVRHLPGESGVIDLVGFLQALNEIGYDGPVAVEPFDSALAALSPTERVRLAADSLHAAFRAARLTTR